MKKDPSVEEREKDLSSRKDTTEFIHELRAQVADDITARYDWERKLEINYQRRYAQLGRGTDWPFPGASDIVVPTMDMTIDRVKAAEVALFANVRPMCAFLPVMQGTVDQARKLEYYFDWRMRYSCPDFFQQLILGLDDRLQTGRTVLKTIYEYQTINEWQTILLKDLPGRLRKFSVLPVGGSKAADMLYQLSGGKIAPISKKEFDEQEEVIRNLVESEFELDPEDSIDDKAITDIMKFFRNGEPEVIVKRRAVKKHYPRMVAVDPLHFIVPSYARDIEAADRVTHRMWFTKDQIRGKVRDANWREGTVDIICKDKAGSFDSNLVNGYSSIEVSKDMREGISAHAGEDLHEVYETHCLYDIDGDGVGERVIVTWSPNCEYPFKFIASPFDHGQVPFTPIFYELNDGRYYASRGIPEKISDLDEEVTQQRRAKLNRMTIANSPTFTYRRGSGFQPTKVTWLPGSMYEVTQQGDLSAIQMPNLDISFDREQQILRSEIESYVGTMDAALTNPLSSNKDPRTATEVNAVTNISNQAIGYRTVLLQLGMQRVFEQLWSLDNQFGPDELQYYVLGEQPEHMTRKEIRGKYMIVPRGTVVNSSPEMEAAKALQKMQVLMNFGPALGQDPRYEINVGTALMDYFNALDPIHNQRIIRQRTPEEVQKIQAQQAQAQQAAQAVQNNEPVPLDQLKQELKKTGSKAPHGMNQQVSF